MSNSTSDDSRGATTTATTTATATADASIDEYPVNVGNYSLTVETDSPEAQKWFDRGINWVANFHREEAAFCFQQAANRDPKLAMAYWGVALCHGPDYNFHEKAGFYNKADQDNGYPSLKTATEVCMCQSQVSVPC